MIEEVEKGDLDVYLSFGFVLFGSFKDFCGVRKKIREDFPNTKMVFHQISPEHLFLVKKTFLNEEQTQVLDQKRNR